MLDSVDRISYFAANRPHCVELQKILDTMETIHHGSCRLFGQILYEADFDRQINSVEYQGSDEYFEREIEAIEGKKAFLETLSENRTIIIFSQTDGSVVVKYYSARRTFQYPDTVDPRSIFQYLIYYGYSELGSRILRLFDRTLSRLKTFLGKTIGFDLPLKFQTDDDGINWVGGYEVYEDQHVELRQLQMKTLTSEIVADAMNPNRIEYYRRCGALTGTINDTFS